MRIICGMATVKILGINDESDRCDHCGKTNLKRTIILDIDGEIVRYGVDCASRALNRKATLIERSAIVAESAAQLHIRKVAEFEIALAKTKAEQNDYLRRKLGTRYAAWRSQFSTCADAMSDYRNRYLSQFARAE